MICITPKLGHGYCQDSLEFNLSPIKYWIFFSLLYLSPPVSLSSLSSTRIEKAKHKHRENISLRPCHDLQYLFPSLQATQINREQCALAIASTPLVTWTISSTFFLSQQSFQKGKNMQWSTIMQRWYLTCALKWKPAHSSFVKIRSEQFMQAGWGREHKHLAWTVCQLWYKSWRYQVPISCAWIPYTVVIDK